MKCKEKIAAAIISY